MAALTSDHNTVFRSGDEFQYEAGGTIFAGGMVCLNAEGKAVAASVTEGLSPTWAEPTTWPARSPGSPAAPP